MTATAYEIQFVDRAHGAGCTFGFAADSLDLARDHAKKLKREHDAGIFLRGIPTTSTAVGFRRVGAYHWKALTEVE